MKKHINLGRRSQVGIHFERQEHHESLLYGKWRAAFMESGTDATSIAHLNEIGLRRTEPMRPIKAWYFQVWLNLKGVYFSFKITTSWKVTGPTVYPPRSDEEMAKLLDAAESEVLLREQAIAKRRFTR